MFDFWKVFGNIFKWRDGRVVDRTGLENQNVRKGIEGSNPSLSANMFKLRHCFINTIKYFFVNLIVQINKHE